MLNRTKMMQQIHQAVPQAMRNRHDEIVIAQRLWRQIVSDLEQQEDLKVGLETYQNALRWQGALSNSIEISLLKEPYTIMGVDGSQIYADRHTGSNWYVINIGSITLQYGVVKSSVHFDSFPQMFAGIADDSRPEMIDAQRSVLELQYGYDLLLRYKHEKSLLLVDGPLQFFNKNASSYSENYIQTLQRFYEDDLLIAGYTSMPASRDLLSICNTMSNMHTYPSVYDRDIVISFLKPGYRSTMFLYASSDREQYPPMLQPWFLYINNGYEIGRIEIPYYIAQNAAKVALVVSMIFDQIIKGQGYPICLAEAHEQAVIKEIDRMFFYDMLQATVSQNNAELGNDFQVSMHQSYQPSQKLMRKKRALL